MSLLKKIPYMSLLEFERDQCPLRCSDFLIHQSEVKYLSMDLSNFLIYLCEFHNNILLQLSHFSKGLVRETSEMKSIHKQNFESE